MSKTVLVLNAGSSSIKFQLFALEGSAPQRRLKGQIEGIGTRPRLAAGDGDGSSLVDRTLAPEEVADLPGAMAVLEEWIQGRLAGRMPIAVGHRVVHGGARFDRPVLIDDEILEALDHYVPLAPLHQPNNLAPVRAIRGRFPDLPQVACFDTAFHRNHGELADRYALPDWLYESGIRRYGFHGLSYEYIASVLPDVAPELAEGRVVAAHLGSGASLCALRAGCSVDSTMGFTALDGLPMGTRPGQLDPGVVLHLFSQEGMGPREVERLLYHECGLKGLSGISNDVRDLLASDDPRARLALDYFAYRSAREIGALATSLGGLDGLVFTAGVGENAAEVRRDICDRLAWLGVALDDEANARNDRLISRPETRPAVHVIPTDEELMIAIHTMRVVGA